MRQAAFADRGGPATPSGSGTAAPALGRFDVVALRVEFQPDTTRFTTGDGTFAGSLFGEGLEPKVDPLPHDAEYFSAHLQFLEHYVSTVSDGRAEVRTWLLPEVVRVSGRMGDYAPTGFDADSDAELSKLAALAREAWSLADGSSLAGRGLVPGRTAFVLFHAGVGRDLELTGTSLDKTPEDLPSLYLSGEALDRLAPGTAPVVGGVPVANTLVIPRTETRRGFNFITDENFLAEFSINGMLAASFLNFLGVPDLFDTETGQSAVGPFDVMDGLGIFAMQGLFPPEPSAWTRAWLGWADVRTATLAEAGTSYSIPHAGSADPASVLKVPISAAEYFLVENRYRSTSGVTLRVLKDGVEREVSIPNDSETFNPYTIEGFDGGVVVAADPYDFALPGGVDENDTPLVGGALVWHVDERRLAETLATNRVNADKERRAIDLEEADGAQDIGYPSGGFFGPSYDAGSPFDFWYEGNPVSVRTASGQELRLYENRFGADTFPASRANDGGASFVEIRDFSGPGEAVTVTVTAVEQGELKSRGLLFVLPKEDLRARLVGGSIQLWDRGFSLFVTPLAGCSTLIYGFANGWGADSCLLAAEPATDGQGRMFALEFGTLRVHRRDNSQTLVNLPRPEVQRATTPLVLEGDGKTVVVGVFGLQGPKLLRWNGTSVSLSSEAEPVASLAVDQAGRLIVIGNTTARVDGTETVWSYPEIDAFSLPRPQFGHDTAGYFGAVASPGALRLLQPDGSVTVLGTDLPQSQGAAAASGSGGLTFDGLSPATAVGDLDGDGLLEAVVADRNRLWAFHRTGAIVSGFPIRLNAGIGSGGPLVTRRTDSGRPVILLGQSDGTMDAFDLGEGTRRMEGFPLGVGQGDVMTPILVGDRLAAVDAAGALREWRWGAPVESAMGLVSPGNSSFVVVDPVQPPEGVSFLLDPSETYNWPNPVQDGRTWIRFEVTEPSDVTVTIVDLAGRRVAELEHQGAPAGVPVEIPWQADVESGVYVARVHAHAVSGRTEDRLVKIAVIR